MNFVFLFINVIIDNAGLTWSSVLIRQTVSRSETPKVRYIGIFELYISPIPVSEHIPVYLLSFVETPRKFIIAIINLRGVSTKLNKYIVFTMQTYKKLIYRYNRMKIGLEWRQGVFHIQIKRRPGMQESRNSEFQLNSKQFKVQVSPLSQVIVLVVVNNGLT